ncbi:MAG: leucine-rich repeat protein [Muribaculaceae bacterium]|nr:leucine-rich repeat protein [Muribaculaceae bacterium]
MVNTNFFNRLICFLIIFGNISFISANVAYQKIGDLYYNLDTSTLTAEVTYEEFQKYTNYKDLTSVDIPSTVSWDGITYYVKSIGRYAFYRSTSLKFVSVQVGVEEIKTLAFNECSSLSSIILPDGLKEIEDYAFQRCNSLSHVVLPDGLVSLGNRVFQDCSSLTSIEFPATIKNIGQAIFLNNPPSEIYLHNIAEWCSINTETPVFNNVSRVFLNGEEIKQLNIPSGVSIINYNTFSDLQCVNSVSFPKSLKQINGMAFYNCKFNKITVESLDDWFNVDFLADPYISIFLNNAELYENNQLITELDFPDNVSRLTHYLFAGISSIKSLRFNDNLSSIGPYSFYGCKGLQSLELPGNLASLGAGSFANCDNLYSLSIQRGDNILKITNAAFNGTPIKELILDKNVSSDGLSDLTSLKSVTIGENVTDCTALKWNAYSDLESVTCLALNPPASQPFTETQYKNLKISVPENSLEVYKINEIWGSFWATMPTQIVLDQSGLNLVPGQKVALTATIIPSDTSYPQIYWSSSNVEIVTVDDTGLVSAIAPGQAKITASTINNLSADCVITVNKVPTEIKLNVDNVTLDINEPFQLSATVLPEGCIESDVLWESDNPDILIVEDGLLKPLAAGSAVVTAYTKNDVKAICNVIILDEIFSVSFEPETIELYPGQSLQLSWSVKAQHVSANDISLSVENTNIAFLDEEHQLKAIRTGETSILAYYDNIQVAECKVKIIKPEIYISNTENYVLYYTSFSLSNLKIEHSDDIEISDIKWKVSGPISDWWYYEDTQTISFLYHSITVTVYASCLVNNHWIDTNKAYIYSKPVVISTPDNIEIGVNTYASIKAEIKKEDNLTPINLSCKSSDNEIVSVVDVTDFYQTCKIVGKKAGLATVTSTVYGGATDNTLVTVKDWDGPEGVNLNYQEYTLPVGDYFYLKKELINSEFSNVIEEWTSSNPDCVTVDEGKVTAVAPGKATVTVSYFNGVKASCEVNVIKYAENLSINTDEAQLEVGGSLQLEAFLEPDDVTETNIEWYSNEPEIAIIDETGLVTAISTGEAHIWATYKAPSTYLTVGCVITVVKYADKLSINIEEAQLEVGGSLQLEAFLEPEDVTETNVEWYSNNRGVAYVDQNGNVTAYSPGEAHITARYRTAISQLEATCVVNVVNDAGIEQIFSSNKSISIYNISGVLIKKDITPDELKKLSKGIYIIKTETQTFKIEK